MSITFYPTNHFTKKIDCICMMAWRASQTGEDQSNAIGLCGDDNCVGYTIAEGTEEVPELNVANANARIILEVLQVEFDYCGTLNPSDVLCALAVARRTNLNDFTRETEILTGGQNVRCIIGGLGVERIQEYIEDLAAVANFALEKETTITWS